MDELITISVSNWVKDKLDSLKTSKNDSYDRVIEKLIEIYKKRLLLCDN